MGKVMEDMPMFNNISVYEKPKDLIVDLDILAEWIEEEKL